MKKYDVNEIIEQYERSGEKMYKATLEGDYRTNNREGAKLTRIFKSFEKDIDLAQKCIPELIRSSNVVVRTKAAAYCLSLKFNVEEGEAVLKEIGDNKENGIFGFNARMTLAVWKKQGYLKMYPDQQIKMEL